MKRATDKKEKIVYNEKHFNPRPREEGDSEPVIVCSASFYFNPRPREEGDIGTVAIERCTYYFNPRPREEGDAFYDVCKSVQIDFNPRPREEGDQSVPLGFPQFCDFNPRPREEGDCKCRTQPTKTSISIHTLVKRATLRHFLPCLSYRISIHALVKRATICGCYCNCVTCNFNPRPREEGDLKLTK